MALIQISGPDPLPGFTATMNFLATAEGQQVAKDIHDVIANLIKFFHDHHVKPLMEVTTK